MKKPSTATTVVNVFLIFLVTTSNISAASTASSSNITVPVPVPVPAASTYSATTINDINNDGDSQEQAVIAGYDGCDESKCVSRGLIKDDNPFTYLFDDSFTCYTDNDQYPMMCADGYQPQIVENEAEVSDEDYDHTTFYYFTCCPPNLLFDINISVRHCSNPTTFRDLNNTMICDDNNQPYPRQMKNYTGWNDELVESYICCDSSIDNNDNQTTNFLNDIECVPYLNENYYYGHNEYGSIIPTTIYCKDSENGFQYISESFECCKTEQGTNSFIQDNAFKATVYPQILLSAIAVVSCTILIVALLIPLWLHLRVQSAVTNVSGSTNRATYRRLKQAAAASTYSSYNLYLVYLAIPDFILNLYLLTMYGSYANQKYNPNFNGLIIDTEFEDDVENDNAFEGALILACSTANLYLNCVVSYEMLVLLRNNDQVVTHNPPSLLRVTLQAMGVYLFSIIVFFIHFFIRKEIMKAGIDYNVTKSIRFVIANLGWSFIVTYIFPFGFFFYIWITIKCRGYMPSVTDGTRQLVWFFFRIVYVFCTIWFLGMLMVVIGISIFAGGLTQVGLLFCGIQPIASTCMVMTKADVRKYILKVVMLSYSCTSISSSASYISTSLSLSKSYICTSLSSRASFIRASLSPSRA